MKKASNIVVRLLRDSQAISVWDQITSNFEKILQNIAKMHKTAENSRFLSTNHLTHSHWIERRWVLWSKCWMIGSMFAWKELKSGLRKPSWENKYSGKGFNMNWRRKILILLCSLSIILGYVVADVAGTGICCQKPSDTGKYCKAYKPGDACCLDKGPASICGCCDHDTQSCITTTEWPSGEKTVNCEENCSWLHLCWKLTYVVDEIISRILSYYPSG